MKNKLQKKFQKIKELLNLKISKIRTNQNQEKSMEYILVSELNEPMFLNPKPEPEALQLNSSDEVTMIENLSNTNSEINDDTALLPEREWESSIVPVEVDQSYQPEQDQKAFTAESDSLKLETKNTSDASEFPKFDYEKIFPKVKIENWRNNLEINNKSDASELPKPDQEPLKPPADETATNWFANLINTIWINLKKCCMKIVTSTKNLFQPDNFATIKEKSNDFIIPAVPASTNLDFKL